MSGGGSRNPTPPIGRPTSTPTPPQVSRVSMVVGAGHQFTNLYWLSFPVVTFCTSHFRWLSHSLNIAKTDMFLFPSCFKTLLVMFLCIDFTFRAQLLLLFLGTYCVISKEAVFVCKPPHWMIILWVHSRALGNAVEWHDDIENWSILADCDASDEQVWMDRSQVFHIVEDYIDELLV